MKIDVTIHDDDPDEPAAEPRVFAFGITRCNRCRAFSKCIVEEHDGVVLVGGIRCERCAKPTAAWHKRGGSADTALKAAARLRDMRLPGEGPPPTRAG